MASSGPASEWSRSTSTCASAERRIRCKARGVEDESAGYHPRHTVWSWSAGVGTLTDGREVGWNLVEGVNDPPERSERAIWVDGEPFEPGPSTFGGLETIGFDDGSGIEFVAEAERSRTEKRGPISYSYRQPFGTFTGTLPGGLRARERHGRHGEPRRALVSERAAQLLGEWTLVSWTGIDCAGRAGLPWRRQALRRIVYLESGRMAVQIQHDGRVPFGSRDWSAGDDDERAAAYSTYNAYCGTFSVPEPGVVVHHVEQAIHPDHPGMDKRREFELEGDQLKLRTQDIETPEGPATSELVWRRRSS